MKKFQCPLCGTVLQFFHELKFGGLGRVGCSSCEWVTFLASPPQAWEAAEEFISKFPPIMRVWPGDKLQVNDGSICEVINVNKNQAVMDVRRGEGRPVFTIADTHVIRWPWELEQEGGTEQ